MNKILKFIEAKFIVFSNRIANNEIGNDCRLSDWRQFVSSILWSTSYNLTKNLILSGFGFVCFYALDFNF